MTREKREFVEHARTLVLGIRLTFFEAVWLSWWVATANAWIEA